MAPQQTDVFDSIPKQSTMSIDEEKEKKTKRWYTFSFHNVNEYKREILFFEAMPKKTMRMSTGGFVKIEPKKRFMTRSKAEKYQESIEEWEDRLLERLEAAKQLYYKRREAQKAQN